MTSLELKNELIFFLKRHCYLPPNVQSDKQVDNPIFGEAQLRTILVRILLASTALELEGQFC